MIVTVRLFARARQLAGAETMKVALPEGASIAALRDSLVSRCPSLAALSGHLLFAVGTDYVTDETRLHPGEEIAVFPPVSGG